MKWYSIKKYRPPISTYCLIFTENNYTEVARLESKENPNIWIKDYDCGKCQESAYEKIYGVSHFCIPDPVEIEE